MSVKRMRFFFFCLITLCGFQLCAVAETPTSAQPRLGDPLGEHLGLVTAVLIAAAVIVLVIGAISVIRRK